MGGSNHGNNKWDIGLQSTNQSSEGIRYQGRTQVLRKGGSNNIFDVAMHVACLK